MVDRLDDVRTQLVRALSNAALVLGAALVFAACKEQPAKEPAVSAPPSKGEGGALVSLDSALKLFRVGLDSMAELENAEPSIEATVARFRRMVEQRDTAAMRSLVMSQREYAWLYYPSSVYTRSPTMQEPGLNWFLHLQNSQKGATRVFERFGGKPLALVSNECKGPSRQEGDNRMWYDCVQRIREGSDTTVIRLFGGIIERNGRFKIFSYSNDL